MTDPKTVHVHSPDHRPKDRQEIVYLFEPFNKWYVGVYDAEYDSVGGASGFTTWVPEVLGWFPTKNKS